jgi:ribosomal protein L19
MAQSKERYLQSKIIKKNKTSQFKFKLTEIKKITKNIIMDTIRDITKQYFRTDLPPLEVGDEVEITTKNFNQNEKDKFRLTHFKGAVIAQKNKGQISYTFSVLKESKKVVIRSIFSYHSPLIVSIKKLGKIKEKVRRAKLYYREREQARKKANE